MTTADRRVPALRNLDSCIPVPLSAVPQAARHGNLWFGIGS
jgi:hypothetical protein